MKKRIEMSKKAYTICKAVLMIICFVYTFFMVINSKAFCINDDLVMRSIVSGEFSGTPDGHMVFIMYVLGLPMSLLYKLIPNVPWYDITVLTVHIGSLVFISLAISEYVKNYFYRLLIMLFSYITLVLIDYSMIVQSMFTVTAALPMVASIIFGISAFVNEERKKDLVYSIIFSVLSLVIRKDVFLLGLPVLFGGILICILPSFKKELKDLIKFSAVFLICFLTCVTVEKLAYSKSEWKEYLEYSKIRSEIQDYYGVPMYDYAREVYEKNGLTRSDYYVLAKHNISFIDEHTIDVERQLRDISKELSDKNKEQMSLKDSLLRTKRELWETHYQPVGIMIIILLLASLLVSICAKEWLSVLASLGIVLYEVVVATYFFYLDRFPERVSYSLSFMVMIFLLCFFLKGYKKLEFGENRKVVVTFFLLILFVKVLGRFSEIQDYRTKYFYGDFYKRIEMTDSVMKYCEEHEENTYIISSSISKLTMDYLVKKEYEDLGNSFHLSYWLDRSPLFEDRKANKGISSFSEELLNNENCFVLQRVDEDPKWIDDYYFERGVEVKTVLVDTFSEGDYAINVYKVTR